MVKSYVDFISSQQKQLVAAGLAEETKNETLDEAVANKDPIAYHTKMSKHHFKMAEYHAGEREEADDEGDSDSAHDHANDQNHHERAGERHEAALEAHKKNHPDAMKKTKEAWKESDKRGVYHESEPPKAHAMFGKKHGFN